jgi:hypothetical protein
LEVALQQVDETVIKVDLENFKAKAEKIMDSLNVIVEGGQTADDFDKERQSLYTHIESLSDQVKQVSQ